MTAQPARYFPIKPTPFRFQAGLVPFGTDFGNGATDRLFFQVDTQRGAYLAAKQGINPARHHVLERDEAERGVHSCVLPWIQATLQQEHPELCGAAPEAYRELSKLVQEDLVVLHRRADGSDAAIAVDVSFPSDWRPERIVGTDFRFIHAPVPGFADGDPQARALVTAMIDRGPHVRFVWTLTAGNELDRHPEEGRRIGWQESQQGFLRVERQVTVPFREVHASLFLIRTYLYPFAELSAEQRARIATALDTMPETAARYKNHLAALSDIRRLLRVG